MDDHKRYSKPLTDYIESDFTKLNKNLTVEKALVKIRKEGVGNRIVYFYVVDEEEKLVGVLPTRRLLIAETDETLESIMIDRVASLPDTATVYDALEYFATYKFLAFPVVDKDNRIIGLIDVNMFTEQLLTLEPDVEERQRYDYVFEAIGFRLEQIKNATPLKAWQIRLPWLMATVASGTICALLVGVFEATLAESLVIAFFLTLVLGLGESVSIQSMTLTIRTLNSVDPSTRWYIKNLIREFKTTFLLGLSCGVFVALVVVIWKGALLAGITIGLSIILVEMMAAFWGLSVPAILHSTNLDPKISAGPLTLALTDMSTIIFYFGLATIML